MKTYLIKTYLLGLQLILIGNMGAQKNILISDSLEANAEKMEITRGTQPLGKIRSWSFGGFTIVSSKNKLAGTGSKENFFRTKTQDKVSKKFSFVMRNNRNDLAETSTLHKKVVVAHHAFEVSQGFYIGDDGVTQESDEFSAVITVNGDTSDTWTLIMNSKMDRKEGNLYESYLTNGERKIILVPVSSNEIYYYKRSFLQFRSIPASGFEFIENGKSLCAIQNFAGEGIETMAKKKDSSGCVVWMLRSSDEKMKLILAAAMTSILQMTNS